MKLVISFSTSQPSNDRRTFSQDFPKYQQLSLIKRMCELTASSLTHTVDAILAKLHKLLLVKSSLSSSKSWNFCEDVLVESYANATGDVHHKRLSSLGSTSLSFLPVP